MDLFESIKDNFAKGYIGKAMSLSILPSDNMAWTIKQERWIGVAIAIGKGIEFSERFANVRLYTEDNVVISGKEYTLLILRCDEPTLRDEFSTICYHFVSPGENGATRKALIASPEKWWNQWKSLLGNRDSETEAYSIMGELLVLEYLIKKGIKAIWHGAEGGVQDIQTERVNYEVKSTTSRYGYEVTINSIYQLKNKGADLKLVFCRFERAPIGTDLNSLVVRLKSLGYPEDLLEQTLEASGLEKGCTARSKKYRLIEMKSYDVDDSFPAITESSFKGDVIPKNILRINYTVDLSGLPCENIFETEQKK